MKNLYKIPVALLSFLFCFNPLYAQIEFIENKGQWNDKVIYKGAFSTGAFFIEKNSFSVLLHNPEELKKISERMHGHAEKLMNQDEKMVLNSFSYRVSFLGASINMKSIPEKPFNSYNNYFIGNDQSKWASGCRLFQAITCKDVYPNIDLRYYSEGDKLKYDFIIRPGGNVSQIAMQYDGPSSISVKKKELIIKTPVGDVKEEYPYSYQSSSDGTQREEVACRYVLRNNVVTFDIKNYDPNKTLVIDPAVIFSTLTGSKADNWGYAATPGPEGSLFAGGIVFGNAGDVVPPGAFQSVFSGGFNEGGIGGFDIAIFKFSPDGTQREYATYLGGSGNEQPHSMIADANGNLIIAGRSSSSNYPTTGPLIGSGGDNDIILTKLNTTGTGIIGSLRIGGSDNDGVNIRSKYEGNSGSESLRRNYGDDARSEVILDENNDILLASCTQSSNFPVKGPSLNNPGGFGGGQDGLILKFNSNLSSYIFGSYFGGSGDDACFVVSINPVTKNIFVAGGTTSSNLPGNKSGTIGNSFKGGVADGFITQILSDGSAIIKTSYLGTNGVDIVYGLKFDRKGFPYVMGTTTGLWPVINASYSIPNSSQFISKLKPDFSGYVYSTVFGDGSLRPNLSPIGFLVDRCENVYVSGWGGGINSRTDFGYENGTTQSLPLKNPLSGTFAPDGEDLYFFVLKKEASDLLFASNFGQNGGEIGDHVDGGTNRFDENGVIYQAICANCSGGKFPTTPNAWSSVNGSSRCNEAAVKIEMSFSGVTAGIKPVINNKPYVTIGCVPITVNFNDTLQKGKTYYWDFGNGQKDTTYAPDFSTSASYNTVGTYIVRLISEDSLTCNIRDTTYIQIKASDIKALLNFSTVKELPCTNLKYSFINSSVPTNEVFRPKSFVWDYGDGSPLDTSFNGSHTYASIGEYTVKLTLIDTVFCNSPETKTFQLRADPLVKAKFSTPGVGCAPYNAVFTNESGTTDVTWLFDDGTTTTVENPTKSYPVPGNYRVRLVAKDPNTCNQVDTSDLFTIIVSDKPKAEFSWQPNPPINNTPVSFTNLSQEAVRYEWNFGDGENSTNINPKHIYNETGTYTAELIAFNQYECTDTFRLSVETLITPLLDVPNAFTPGNFGVNSKIFVVGFGIIKMNWKIYNRWGQLVFQSNDTDAGWDGKFKGKDQPMDVYTYTLDAEFSDGKKIRKTGDITLIR